MGIAALQVAREGDKGIAMKGKPNLRTIVWESLTCQRWRRWEEQNHNLQRPYAFIHALEEWRWVEWDVDYLMLIKTIDRWPNEKHRRLNRFLHVFKMPGRAKIEGKEVFLVFQSLGKKEGMVFSAYHQSRLIVRLFHARLRNGPRYYGLTQKALEKIYGDSV